LLVAHSKPSQQSFCVAQLAPVVPQVHWWLASQLPVQQSALSRQAPPCWPHWQMPLRQFPVQQSPFFTQALPRPAQMHCLVPSATVAQTPLQQSPLMLQLVPLPLQMRQALLRQLWLQQSPSAVQLPVVLHAHRWLVQTPLQQSPAVPQAAPTVAHWQAPLVEQVPKQQSPSDAQVPVMPLHLQKPPEQLSVQQSPLPVQVAPTTAQVHCRPNTPEQLLLQQSVLTAHTEPPTKQQLPPTQADPAGQVWLQVLGLVHISPERRKPGLQMKSQITPLQVATELAGTGQGTQLPPQVARLWLETQVPAQACCPLPQPPPARTTPPPTEKSRPLPS
jgi:hypothetical protein